jgi:cell wall-associated NlpC family hydrolase
MARSSYFLLCSALLFLIISMSSCSSTQRSSSHGKYSKADRHRRSDDATQEKTTSVNKKKKSVKDTERISSSSDVANTKMSHQRKDILTNAMKYKGLQYKSGGRTPETGFDCSGFTSYVYTESGIPLSGPSDKQSQLAPPKDIEDLKPGDLIFFGNENRISHVAIVATTRDSEIEVIHSTTSAGVKVDNITSSDYWRSRILFGIDIVKK